MTHLQFAQPMWLWVGALCCTALIVLFVQATRLRGRALAALAGPRFVTTASRARRATKQALVLLGVAATFVCLARPLAGFRWEEERQEGTDVMFAVDTSKSMLTPDLRPNRLTRAKLAVSDLLREFPSERAGLIAFAGDAFVQAPMTIDHEIFGEALDALDTGIIARGGTNVAAPIRAAIDAMATEPDRHKVLVLLSDGEDLQGEAIAAARDAARAGLVIYTVGVGTSAGDLVPVERDGVTDVMRDADGQTVHSRLDEQTLREVAAATGGAYAALGPSGRGLETLYRQHLAQLPRRTVAERMHKVYTERFQIPLAIAIGCLLLELALGERRRVWRRAAKERAPLSDRGLGARGAVTALGGVALALLTLSPRTASAAEPRDTKPSAGSTSVSSYNDGTAAYRKKDFSSAQRHFQEATHTTDTAVQQDAYYDLGNARYRVGQASLAKDRPATIEAWKSSVAAYDGALALQPKDADARFNRDLVKKRLAALEEQERQKQNQQKDEEQKQPNKQSQQAQEKQQGQQNDQNKQKQQGQQGDQNKQSQQGRQSQPGQQGQQSKENQGGAGTTPPSSAGGGAKGQQHDQADGLDQGPSPKTSPQPGQAASPPAQPTAPQHQGPGVVSGQPGRRADKAPSSDARRAPGALSASEAEQLLDSANGDLRRMPVAGTRQNQPNADDPPAKDW